MAIKRMRIMGRLVMDSLDVKPSIMVMIRDSSITVYLRKFLRFIQRLRHNGKMDLGKFNLFIKMIEEEYKLEPRELQKVSQRLLADEGEFEKVWILYRNKTSRSRNGVDEFRPVLYELVLN
jgi:hypothetical protein